MIVVEGWINMSENIIIVEHHGKRAKIKYTNLHTLKNGIERKLGVSFHNHRLEYHDSSHDEWIGIYDDDDLEDITEQTRVRIIPEGSGKKIYVKK